MRVIGIYDHQVGEVRRKLISETGQFRDVVKPLLTFREEKKR